MTSPFSRLPPEPDITFDESGLIIGETFKDSYFSRDDGLEETRKVFLEGCGLPQAWAGRSSFTIAELGFGTGLNALATWDLWRKARHEGQILHFVTTEAFLMKACHAAQAHARWPELALMSAQLLARWPVRAFGSQRIWFEDDRFCLTILIGPALASLQRMDFRADAWFLDGFAPSRNQDMWSPELLQEVTRLSAPGARLATYSVAGAVRRTLVTCGYEVNRRQGFGSKRQRLEAILPGAPVVKQKMPARVMVIGGGIAGAALSIAFARRGVAVDLIDSDPCGQTKASRNPAALIMPRLDRGDTREARFFRDAYLYASGFYQCQGSDLFAPLQVKELPGDDRDQIRLSDLADNPPLPADELEAMEGGGLLHRRGGLVYPDRLLPALTQHVTRHPVEVSELCFCEGQWQALDKSGTVITQADICVVAAGTQIERFIALDAPLEGRAGQISLSLIQGELPMTALAGGPYAAAFNNQLLFGATFDPWDLARTDQPPVEATNHERNQASLAAIAPDLAARIDLSSAFGRSSIRCAPKDRMPIAGRATHKMAQASQGLFVLGALGSRGFTTALWLAEHVAALACNDLSPFDLDVAFGVSPERFKPGAKAVRKLRRAWEDRPKG